MGLRPQKIMSAIQPLKKGLHRIKRPFKQIVMTYFHFIATPSWLQILILGKLQRLDLALNSQGSMNFLGLGF